MWDHLAFVWGAKFADPSVALSAVAASTTRLHLGTGVTPVARRRPHVLAHTLATLDVLSRGRVVLGVGLGGVPEEFSAFGEDADMKRRARMLDKGLEVMTRLWSGSRVDHHGEFYTVNGVTLSPLPMQRPRIPVWVGGESEPALRRAVRWDGWIIGGAGPDGKSMTKTPKEIARKVERVRRFRDTTRERTDNIPFEIALTGYSNPTDQAPVRQSVSGLSIFLREMAK